MKLKGVVRGHVIELPIGAELPDGTEVTIEVVTWDKSSEDAYDRFQGLSARGDRARGLALLNQLDGRSEVDDC
jgi:hypothetical protein